MEAIIFRYKPNITITTATNVQLLQYRYSSFHQDNDHHHQNRNVVVSPTFSRFFDIKVFKIFQNHLSKTIVSSFVHLFVRCCLSISISLINRKTIVILLKISNLYEKTRFQVKKQHFYLKSSIACFIEIK